MELKIGGIYQEYLDTNNQISNYFVILKKIEDVYFGYRILETKSNIVSRKDILEFLEIIELGQIVKKENFFFRNREILDQSVDGYLGTIRDIDLTFLKDGFQGNGPIQFLN